MHVLMGQSYFRVLDPKELSRQMPYPPLGTLICAELLRRAGHEVTFFDAMLGTPEEFMELYHSDDFDLVAFYDDEFNYLTKMSLSRMRETVLSLSRQIEEPVVVYSSDAMYEPDLYLSSGIDYVISGEGEFTLIELLGGLSGTRSLEGIQGLNYYDGGLRSGSKRPLHANLDDFPDPAFDLVDMEAYRNIWLKHHGYFSINVSTSRGCTYGCNWCSKPLWGRTYHAHSPRRVANLMYDLSRNYGVDHFWITDDIFGLKRGWLEQFRDVLLDLNFIPRYKCLSRADLLVRDNTVELLKQTGCQTVWVGAESGSQKILDAMEKGTKVEQIREAASLCREYGIEICFFIQFGYLGETWEDIELTRKLILETLPDDIGISVSYPLPGTKFFEIVKERLGEKRNWEDSDDLDPLFPGSFPREFYKSLHRLVHNEYRLALLQGSWRPRSIVKKIFHWLNKKRYEREVKPYMSSRVLLK